ncbi:MAG: methionyl-tRNA formyltransferase [Treponema sp.]|jgi:methionyl-tRNA formyltransferase|nr:methionyl-tRNA formyltransferase [Treponema sp.]
MMRVLYAGTPEPSALTLGILLEASEKLDAVFQVAGVLTNPPARQARNRTPEDSPVAVLAKQTGIPCVAPEKLDGPCRDKIAALKPDLLACFAFGKIFGPQFMALFSLGGVNLHPSLLPKYRGAAPVQAAILNREAVTGITVQRLAPEMDSGDILLQREIPLSGTETAVSLLDFAAREGARALTEVLEAASRAGNLPAGIPQNHAGATYCTQLRREDGRINWAQSAPEIDAQIRAFDPWPGAFTLFMGESLKIRRASVFSLDNRNGQPLPGTVLGIDKQAGILVQTGKGILGVLELQRQAKKEVPWKDFINGNRNFTGTKLG